MAIAQRSALFSPSSILSRLQQAIALELQAFCHPCPLSDISSNTSGASMHPSQRRRYSSASDREGPPTPDPQLSPGLFDISAWKTIDSRAFGIRRSAISSSTWTVLKILQGKGFEAYLVGGCVRDLLLKRAPKDFDVITTASLNQIRKHFHRCMIVGRRFPICHVSILDSVIEVSSFNTSHNKVEDKRATISTQMPRGCNEKDFVRWKSSMERDFTINGLFYDPFVNTIYDYVDGIGDLRTSKVRTVIPAHLSFKQDCARILRGLRIAARLGLQFSTETSSAIIDHSSSIMTLGKSRLMMELNYMMAYGAAESSIRLLQNFKLLEILLPVQAAYLADHTESQFDECSIMLMELFSNFDKLFAADRPSNCTLWLAVLAFHLALLFHPRDALVIWTFSSILYHGTWFKAVPFARECSTVDVKFLPEILVPIGTKSDEQLLEEVSHFASLVASSVSVLTSTDVLRRVLTRYSDILPCSGLVFVSDRTGKSVAHLFDVLKNNIKSYAKERKTCCIDYKLLKKGNLDETRFVLGKIIMDTMKGKQVLTCKQNQDKIEEERSHLGKINCEVKHNMASVEESCLNEVAPEQNLDVIALKETHFKATSDKKYQKVTAGKKLRKRTGQKNQKAAVEKNNCKDATDRNHQLAVAEKNCAGNRNEAAAGRNHPCELAREQNDNSSVEKTYFHEIKHEVAAAEKNCEGNRNEAAAERSHPCELTREQNDNASSVERRHFHEVNHEENEIVAAVKKKRTLLSTLFK